MWRLGTLALFGLGIQRSQFQQKTTVQKPQIFQKPYVETKTPKAQLLEEDKLDIIYDHFQEELSAYKERQIKEPWELYNMLSAYTQLIETTISDCRRVDRSLLLSQYDKDYFLSRAHYRRYVKQMFVDIHSCVDYIIQKTQTILSLSPQELHQQTDLSGLMQSKVNQIESQTEEFYEKIYHDLQEQLSINEKKGGRKELNYDLVTEIQGHIIEIQREQLYTEKYSSKSSPQEQIFEQEDEEVVEELRVKDLICNDFEIWDRVDYSYKYSRKELQPYIQAVSGIISPSPND